MNSSSRAIDLLTGNNNNFGVQNVVRELDVKELSDNMVDSARSLLYQGTMNDISNVQVSYTNRIGTHMFMDDELRRGINATADNFIQSMISLTISKDYLRSLAPDAAKVIAAGQYDKLTPLQIAAYLDSSTGKELLQSTNERSKLQLANKLASSMYKGLADSRLDSMRRVTELFHKGNVESNLTRISEHQLQIRKVSDILSPMEKAYKPSLEYLTEFGKIKQLQTNIVMVTGAHQGVIPSALR